MITEKNNEHKNICFWDSEEKKREDENCSELDGNPIGRRRNIRREVNTLNIGVNFLLECLGIFFLQALTVDSRLGFMKTVFQWLNVLELS